MRYRVNSQWPVQGGATIISGGVIVDDSQPGHAFLRGVVPPPDVIPLDQVTREWLIRAYQFLPDHNVTIAPVPK
jgi:hypothetical protein